MDWFARQLLKWHDKNGRKDLPWQHKIDPYRVWVSEIMLQQTQVTTVIDYYNRFMQRFTTVEDLAAAPLDEVLHHWTGLGYYARARNLHKTANMIIAEHSGKFPEQQTALEGLPGIGRSTAGAIRAIAMNQHAAILDGNVKRVLTRFHTIAGYPGATEVTRKLWAVAEEHTPVQRTGNYTQAIMDLGAMVCTRRAPRCEKCPVSSRCQALTDDQVSRYPEPKAKKAKPERSARFFVTSLPNGATLLEQRPLQGLWGGLWNPPERSANTATDAFLEEIGATRDQLSNEVFAAPFRHTFTHFHLQVEPVYLQLSSAPLTIADTDAKRWVHPDEMQNANEKIGLSAVAVRLLSEATSAEAR